MTLALAQLVVMRVGQAGAPMLLTVGTGGTVKDEAGYRKGAAQLEAGAAKLGKEWVGPSTAVIRAAAGGMTERELALVLGGYTGALMALSGFDPMRATRRGR